MVLEPCGTPACLVSQSDVWPLSKTLWNLPLKKLLINWNKFPLTLFFFNLNNNPSCQTLSNALDMSRNIPRRILGRSGAFCSSHPSAAPKRPILNRVKSILLGLYTTYRLSLMQDFIIALNCFDHILSSPNLLFKNL